MEKSEIKEYKGYRYITIKMLFGYHHVCGYVEIPREHYLFGKSYCEPIPELEPYNKRVLEGYSGKRGQMAILGYALNQEKSPLPAEMFFDVHGSLTFGDRLMPRGESAPIFEWAMGFDTAHVDDDETTQTHEFCELECRLFIDQLVSIDKAMNDNTLPSPGKPEKTDGVISMQIKELKEDYA